MKISSNLFLGIFIVGLSVGCAGTPKRTAATAHPKTTSDNSKEIQSYSQTLTIPQPDLKSSKAQTDHETITQPNPVTIPVAPNENQQSLQPESPSPPQKHPTPDLGRKLPKLIYSEDLGLYTSPSTVYEIYFWNAQWYVRSEGIWFRADDYRGPWQRIDVSTLPEKIQSTKR